jgi:hypothetical protein
LIVSINNCILSVNVSNGAIDKDHSQETLPRAIEKPTRTGERMDLLGS